MTAAFDRSPVDKANWCGGSDPIGFSLGDDRLGTPAAILRASAIDHNGSVMARYCAANDVELMPHAKTSMSPELVRLQLGLGATGMTAAVPWQVLQLWRWGVDRVFVANEIMGLAELGALLAERVDGRQLWHYVDSDAGIDLAVRAHGSGDGRPVDLLVELGHDGGRTGARSVAAAAALAERVAADRRLRLVGVAGYEGLIAHDRHEQSVAAVDRHLADLGHLAARCAPLIDGEPVVSAGGSAFFDRVVAVLGPVTRDLGGRLILRSGCYLTHDHGLYERLSPAVDPGWRLPRFRPAMEVWTRVLSRPEPTLILVNAGRRDLSFDADPPTPVAARALGADDGPPDRRIPTGGWSVTGLSDQHAFVTVPADAPVRPGDLVALGISHPCTTFDKWSTLWMVDDDDRVVSPVTTAFG